MTGKRKFHLLCCFFFMNASFMSASLHAQVEVAHLFSKGHSSTGLGAFLHAGASLSNRNEVGGEAGIYYFAPNGSHIAFAPILAFYRHFFDASGSGLYIEPVAGYTFGGTDIQKTDAMGNPLYDASGKVVNQKISGATAGMGFGYIIPSTSFPFNIGLRYEHLFISGDPSQNMLSLRLSYSLIVGRKAK